MPQSSQPPPQQPPIRRDRAHSEAKEPHPVTLKVLRLSRPTLAEHHPAPITSSPLPPTFSHPSADPTSPFLLTPQLTLPASFGSVFIGETFRCLLSANPPPPSSNLNVTGIKIAAEMQTPGKIGPGTGETVPLELGGRDAAVVEFELREEGGHTLAVTVGYTQGTRERTFRKLYQFQAVHCVLVRTKASVVPVVSEGKGKGVEGMVVLEAQLENVSEGEVVLEGCEVLGELKVETLGVGEEVLMKSRDVAQVAFLVKAEREEVKRAGIGMLQIRWRGMGGEMGVLKTGKLGVGV